MSFIGSIYNSIASGFSLTDIEEAERKHPVPANLQAPTADRVLYDEEDPDQKNDSIDDLSSLDSEQGNNLSGVPDSGSLLLSEGRSSQNPGRLTNAGFQAERELARQRKLANDERSGLSESARSWIQLGLKDVQKWFVDLSVGDREDMKSYYEVTKSEMQAVITTTTKGLLEYAGGIVNSLNALATKTDGRFEALERENAALRRQNEKLTGLLDTIIANQADFNARLTEAEVRAGVFAGPRVPQEGAHPRDQPPRLGQEQQPRLPREGPLAVERGSPRASPFPNSPVEIRPASPLSRLLQPSPYIQRSPPSPVHYVGPNRSVGLHAAAQAQSAISRHWANEEERKSAQDNAILLSRPASSVLPPSRGVVANPSAAPPPSANRALTYSASSEPKLVDPRKKK